jgi:alkanesulfonate monooxygenase SsuD/methylene tetrahydromethanopterin reductase-like flavin-dependent oxidoreductase (luciferase family)
MVSPAHYRATVQYGLTLPPFDELADPSTLMTLAREAEARGWDGLFLWDHLRHRPPVHDVADPWIALAGIATATERITLGPLVTPLARRRPHIVAKQTVTLDQLSAGRLVLGVGLGLDGSGRELSGFGEEMDDRVRAAMLDESLAVIESLWSGEQVDFHGEHYLVDGVSFSPRPVQRPRIPIWLAARWPYQRPLLRASRWDGLFPIDLKTPEQLVSTLVTVSAARGGLEGFDVAVHAYPGEAPGPWAAAGATWWLLRFDGGTTADQVRRVIDAGPPTS